MDPRPPASPPSPPPLLGGIEAGGTKYVCAVAFDPSQPLEEIRFPTGPPRETLRRVADFFQEACDRHGPLGALGIGTFGPARVDPRSADYGHLLTTPKPGWSDFPLVAALREELPGHYPIDFATDVQAAALGEAVYGAGRELANLAYVTVGTGIGGAFLEGTHPLRGRLHPEMGHLIVPDLDAAFGKDTCVCPFHDSCLEGRACGPAIQARWGVPAEELPPDHPAWELEAQYLAIACIQLTATWSPDLILLGGGVPQKEGLLDKVRQKLQDLAGGYWDLPPLDQYVQLPALGQQAGIIGALTQARRLLEPTS